MPSHSEKHSDANDAMRAIQQKLGVTGVQPPEGNVASPAGSLYADRDKGRLWFKQSGAAKTGWGQVATVGGGFDPSLVPWLGAWWASDPSWSNPGDGNAVSSWRDYSGNGYDLSQGTGTKQPLYRASFANLNGQPAVQFDGSNDFLFQGWKNIDLFTVLIVAYYTSGLFFHYGGNRWGCYASGGTFHYHRSNGADIATAESYSLPHATMITIYHSNSGTSKIRADGGGFASGAMGNETTTSMTVGAAEAGSSSWMNGAIAFMGIYSGDLSSSSSYLRLLSGIRTTYGLTIT